MTVIGNRLLQAVIMVCSLTVSGLLWAADEAGQTQGQAGKPRTSTNPLHRKVFDKWITECEMSPDGKSEKCFASQTQISKEHQQLILKFSVGSFGNKEEWAAVAILPLGISIPAGVAFKVDDAEPIFMQLQQCTGNGCLASVALEKNVMTAIKKGKILSVGVLPFGFPKTMAIPVDLQGFSSAVAALPKAKEGK
ncbi:invasion associated locus B family protein [Candidatus Magnetaquicoccus inordinatus]|uniref:invasion associated locus B family protein n=1 Tax=Candidatus Magnetaquicoccus inordinatus TaxID=2496818 RepID=UPI00102CEAFC|nr:invasion associated locus B family protein [Candidatus Magnetaquicoccus inordinatus]